MRYRTYPAYKDSGVEWLGEVPAHWVGCRLKHALAEMDSGGTPDTSNLDYWTDGDDGVPWVAIGDMSGVDVVSETSKAVSSLGIRDKGLHIFPKGTLLFSMYASLGHVAELAMPATTNQAILGMVPGSGINQSFLKRWLQFLQPYLLESASSNTQANLNAEKVRNLPFVKVNELEQTTIAAFLDRETAKLDTLIARQEKLIELLQEKRQALISHAVTKGLNPDAPMKDSGVEWLGEVPAHWEITPIKHIVSVPVTDGPHETPEFFDEGVPFVSAEAVSTGKIDFEKIRGFISTEDHRRYSLKYSPRIHDIYMVKSGATTGVSAIVETDLEFNIWSPLAVIRCGDAANPYFILNVIRSRNFQEAIALNWSFGTQQNIGMGVIQNLPVPIPPLEEQAEIASYLGAESNKLDTLTEKSSRSIELMREHRTALISAAVTGKIDVRTQHQATA